MDYGEVCKRIEKIADKADMKTPYGIELAQYAYECKKNRAMQKNRRFHKGVEEFAYTGKFNFYRSLSTILSSVIGAFSFAVAYFVHDPLIYFISLLLTDLFGLPPMNEWDTIYGKGIMPWQVYLVEFIVYFILIFIFVWIMIKIQKKMRKMEKIHAMESLIAFHADLSKRGKK